MMDDIIQQQIAYYRARASEYDEWFYRLGRYDHGELHNRQWFKEVEVVMRALHQTGPTGYVLELAAGTGNWTQELLKISQHITALDASPEMLEINRKKVKAPNVTYQEVDLFTWQPDKTYDMIFFGFWLSHVPPEKLDDFLGKVRAALKIGGKLFLVDSRFAQTSTAKDQVLDPSDSVVIGRTLNDGREYRIVKVFYQPELLQNKLADSGIAAQVMVTDHFFIYAKGTRRE